MSPTCAVMVDENTESNYMRLVPQCQWLRQCIPQKPKCGRQHNTYVNDPFHRRLQISSAYSLTASSAIPFSIAGRTLINATKAFYSKLRHELRGIDQSGTID